MKRLITFGLLCGLCALCVETAAAANIYVRSTDGSNGDNGLSWANAKLDLAGAAAGDVATDTIYVSDNHAEDTAGSVSLAFAGTVANPSRILCVDDSAEPPTALATSATARAERFLTQGNLYCYGIAFTNDTTDNTLSSDSNADEQIFEECELSHVASNLDTVLGSSTNGGRITFINTEVYFNNANQQLRLGSGQFVWRGGSVQGTVPTNLIDTLNGGSAVIRRVDLSLLTSGNLVDAVSGTDAADVLFQNCKLGSGVSLLNATINSRAILARAINCDSGDTNYRYTLATAAGTITNQTGAIVRSGGATDRATPISYKMVTTANSKIFSPLVSDPILVWCDTLTSQTVDVHFLSFKTALMQDDDVWAEAEYAGTSGVPLYLVASDRMTNAVFGTPANHAADTAVTWTGTARQHSHSYNLNDVMYAQGRLWICTDAGPSEGTEPAGFASASDGGVVTETGGDLDWRAAYRQKTTVTFTPQEKGLYLIYMNLAEPSTTVYFDPKVQGGVRQFMTAGAYVNEGGTARLVGPGGGLVGQGN